jgi:hypothetical protein
MRHTDHQHLPRLTPLKRALSALVCTLSLLMLVCAPSLRTLHAKPIKVKGHQVEVGGTLKGSSKVFLLKGELLSRTSEGIYLLTQQDGFAVDNQCPTFIPLQSIDFVRVKISKIDRFGHPLLDTALLTALSITNGLFLVLTLPAALIASYIEHRTQHNLIEREFRGDSRMLHLYTRFPNNYTYEGYTGCVSLEEGLVNFKPIKTLASNALALRGLGRRFQLRLGGSLQYWGRAKAGDVLVDEQVSYGVNAQLIMFLTRWRFTWIIDEKVALSICSAHSPFCSYAPLI